MVVTEGDLADARHAFESASYARDSLKVAALVPVFRAAYEQNQEEMLLLNDYLNVLSASGKHEEAYELHNSTREKQIAQGREVSVLQLDCSLLRDLGRIEEAVYAGLQVPTDQNYWQAVTSVYISIGEYQRVFGDANRLPEAPHAVDALLGLGDVQTAAEIPLPFDISSGIRAKLLLHQGTPAKALSALEAIDARPCDDSLIGISKQLLGDTEGALNNFHETITRYARSPKQLIDRIDGIRAELALENLGHAQVGESIWHSSVEEGVYSDRMLQNIFAYDPVQLLK